jgi:hypothetical protein
LKEVFATAPSVIKLGLTGGSEGVGSSERSKSFLMGSTARPGAAARLHEP